MSLPSYSLPAAVARYITEEAHYAAEIEYVAREYGEETAWLELRLRVGEMAVAKARKALQGCFIKQPERRKGRP